MDQRTINSDLDYLRNGHGYRFSFDKEKSWGASCNQQNSTQNHSGVTHGPSFYKKFPSQF